MPETVRDEDRQLLEERLDRALDEAWSKVNEAVDQVTKPGGDPSMSIWHAAEAVEYASLLFNLAHGLDDLDPEVKIGRSEDPTVLVKKSRESLRRARELRQVSTVEAYTNIRVAADTLKTAFLDRVKKAPKRPR